MNGIDLMKTVKLTENYVDFSLDFNVENIK